MQAINCAKAQNNLKSIIDEVCEFDEEVIVTTKNNKSVVIVSLDEYNRTHHKLKKEILEAKKQIEEDDFIGINEAFQKAKQAYRA